MQWFSGGFSGLRLRRLGGFRLDALSRGGPPTAAQAVWASGGCGKSTVPLKMLGSPVLIGFNLLWGFVALVVLKEIDPAVCRAKPCQGLRTVATSPFPTATAPTAAGSGLHVSALSRSADP